MKKLGSRAVGEYVRTLGFRMSEDDDWLAGTSRGPNATMRWVISSSDLMGGHLIENGNRRWFYRGEHTHAIRIGDEMRAVVGWLKRVA